MSEKLDKALIELVETTDVAVSLATVVGLFYILYRLWLWLK